MAVDFEKDHKRRTEYLFWPEDLVVKGDLNGRRELPDITDLTASIENEGQGVPVTIRNDGGKAVLVKGFSRWRALVRHQQAPSQAEAANPLRLHAIDGAGSLLRKRLRKPAPQCHNRLRRCPQHQADGQRLRDVRGAGSQGLLPGG